MSIKVSVIMPSLNVVEYIQECIDSVINQSLNNIEIICVDAGSTDGTLEILKENEKNDSRIKVLVADRKSYGYQMNLGLDAANGEYIGIVETDDYVIPNMYQELYEIACNDNLDVVKADFARFALSLDAMTDKEKRSYNLDQETGIYFKDQKLSANENLYANVFKPREELSSFKALMNTWSGIYRREFLEKHEIRHNETLGASFQDNGFWFQTFTMAEKVRFVGCAYYMNRRDNPGSSVHDRNKVYCMNEEYKFIRNFLSDKKEMESQLIGMYCYKKFSNYLFTYNRIGKEHKLGYLVRFSEELIEHQEKQELDINLFPESQLETLKVIMEEPVQFYIETMGIPYVKQEKVNVDESKAKQELKEIKSSLSYKIGRAITFVPRKVRIAIKKVFS